MVTKKNSYYAALGRRKSSTVRARLTPGKGIITINKLSAEEYFDKNSQLLARLENPLKLVDLLGKYDISLLASGGGISSQVDASTLAIAKALSEMNDDLRSTLKRAGYLKRDPREKERKKAGLKRARKREQYSKR